MTAMENRRNPYLAGYRKRGASMAGSRKIRVSRRARRRRRLLRLGIFLGEWVLVLTLLVNLLMRLFAGEPQVDGSQRPAWLEEEAGQGSGGFSEAGLEGTVIQGLSALDYGRHPAWTEDFLTPNEYSRPGDSLEQVNSIFVHYTGNPGTSAAQNRSYFEQLKDTGERSASAHFIIGYEGEILQCIPLDEIGYAVAGRNEDSISIECCYTSKDGSFSEATYDSLTALLQWLVEVYDLEAEDILRHYDCGGKRCPVYYVEHEEAWEELKRQAVQ